MTTAEILSRLESVKKTADGWITRCPGHADRTPSLCVKTGDDGRTLIDCKAGCPPELVCAKMGITLGDLFADKPKRNGQPKKIVATYDYTNAGGELLFQVCRYQPKTFKQRRPDGKGGWIWDTKSVNKVLFRLPEVQAAIKAGRRIYLTGGEKDTLAMVEHGFDSTTNPGGEDKTASKWLAAYTETLRGTNVAIIADKDETGRVHAAAVAQKLFGVAGSVKVIECPDTNGKPVKDAHDFFAAGGEAADLDAIAETAPEFEPSKITDKPNDDPAEVNSLPAIVDAASFLQEKIETPPELVAGILHQGSKLALGGGSKTFKTWTLTDLAFSIATGEPWLSFKTKKGRVLFLNFEIQPAFFQQRIRAVAEAKHITLAHGMIDLWNLRGQAAGYASLFPRIIERVRERAYSLIVLDPLYKIYGEVDENSAGDVAGLMNAIEAIAVETGAAVAFGAHYSKGNQASKESIDRISGSGVFARDPDSILNLTRHEEQDAFTIELTLRNFPPVAPFVVRWLYPLMRRADDLDPAKLKQSNRGGSCKTFTAEMLVKCLGKRSLKTAAFQKLCASEKGIARATFYRLFAECENSGLITKNSRGKWKVSTGISAPVATDDTSQSQHPLGVET